MVLDENKNLDLLISTLNSLIDKYEMKFIPIYFSYLIRTKIGMKNVFSKVKCVPKYSEDIEGFYELI